MKRIGKVLSVGLASAVCFGCASNPVVVSPVGPNPAGVADQSPAGRLQVFSAVNGHSEGTNPTWYQHTDYDIYDGHGDLVKSVYNKVGYYEMDPRIINLNLPPGKYMVKARAEDYPIVKVPVVIESGHVTRVHLDDKWQPGNASATVATVDLPTGTPVGWSITGR